jgi:hypothetical protein
LPLAHKDIFVTRGWRSTAGSRMLADYVSPYNATVVERYLYRWNPVFGSMSPQWNNHSRVNSSNLSSQKWLTRVDFCRCRISIIRGAVFDHIGNEHTTAFEPSTKQ